jgi:hypothetical protein
MRLSLACDDDRVHSERMQMCKWDDVQTKIRRIGSDARSIAKIEANRL